jgi:glycosyltransferase involved in cell wall biosynthesis
MKNEFSLEALNNTEYKRSVPYERVKEYLEQADVCIFPSFAEAFPVSWLEAMAMEKAMVTSNIGWANELIENEKDGLMEDPKNHQIFAQKVLQLIVNKDFRIQIGKQARIKIIKEFSIDIIAQRNIKFYETI